ncbi:dual specificity protein phosphatase 12 [Metschnikowia bicuspidata]|uniref:protein-tyrosine-phosphatase n=1 Tax=Metschnikowia bicuspidata TaxID=27322 RepID=A0A4V1J3C8_9ASCO|nr:dual specificity protein phosphatase 12 [Metschnikowia bicuspidata]
MPQRILGNIYILSIAPINACQDLRADFGVTHVVSVVPGPLPRHLQTYQHLQVEITDEPGSNLLEHLPRMLAFIEDALHALRPESSKHSCTVLVHCAQGESRSVAVVVAYLMRKYRLTYWQALHAVKRKVPGAEPNAGFVQQLLLFAKMGCTVDAAHTSYKEFVARESLRRDPTGALLQQFDTNQLDASTKKHDGAPFNLRCKRCRAVLANNFDIETHELPDVLSRQTQFVRTVPNLHRIISAVDAAKTCSHYFMSEPISWMGVELNKQELEGKFFCFKCDAKVGGYSWRGTRCSCGKWMVPAIQLQSAKVDLMRPPRARDT